MTDAPFNAVLRRASVSGNFNPVDIVNTTNADAAASDRLLRNLSLHCMEVVADGDYRWQLNADTRRQCFHQFHSKQSVAQELETVPEPDSDDQFGHALRALLQGKEPSFPRKKTINPVSWELEQCAAVYDAAQFASRIPALSQEGLKEIEDRTANQIKRLQRLRDIKIVLPTKLFGREHYKSAISSFLRNADGIDDPRPVLLTGIGGAGKSALVASLLHGWRGRTNSPWNILLDFDRPQLSPGEPVEVMREIIRQLITEVELKGKFSARVKKQLVDGLHGVRNALPATGNRRDFQSQESFMLTSTFARFHEDWAKPLRKRSIVLVFDSFEAIDRQGTDAAELVLRLEGHLRENGLTGLRTIVSGRAPPLDEADMERFFRGKKGHFHLKGLSDKAGGQLLQACDKARVFKTKKQREKASSAVAGHPLAIIVLARYAKTHSSDVDELIADLENNEGFKAEFAQIFLYKRILERISDPKVRKLAHPGLVLRVVNTHIIRLVLAKHCLDDEDLAPEQVKQLLDKLRSEYWLVENQPGHESVRHRPDLRRQMLPGMFAGANDKDKGRERARKEELRKSAIAVCKAAARLYRKGPASSDPGWIWWNAIDPDDRWVEAVYYEALSSNSEPIFNEHQAELLFNRLGEDAETLPVSWRARMAALRGDVLSDAEFETLDEELQESAEASAFARRRRRGTGPATKKAAIRAKTLAKSGRSAKTPAASRGPAAIANAGAESGRAKARKAHSVRKNEATESQGKQRTLIQIERDIMMQFSMAEFDTCETLVEEYWDGLRNHYGDRGVREKDGRISFWEGPVWASVLVLANCRKSDRPIKLLSDLAVTKSLGNTHRLLFAAAAGTLSRELFEKAGVFHSRRSDPSIADRRWLGSTLINKDYSTLRADSRAFSLAGNWAYKLAQMKTEFIPDDREVQRWMKKFGELKKECDENGKLSHQSIERISTKAVRNITLHGLLLQELFRTSDVRRLDVFRGLSPELYDPARAILDTLSLEQEQMGPLTDELANSAIYWPAELCFGNSGQRQAKYHKNQAGALVETADRCGVLRYLFELLAPFDSRAGDLVCMYDLITDWFFTADSGDKPKSRR